MFSQQDYRDNPINWSLSLGRWFGIRVRVHLLFLLGIVLELGRGLTSEERMFHPTLVFLGVLFTVVLLHEFGHCYGARRVGGDADDILMWPLGGLASVQAPMTPRAQFLTTAAGPAVNVVGCLLSLLVLLLLGQAGEASLNPFAPFLVTSASVLDWPLADWFVVVWKVNYLLLLFNLLPIFPLDGGRMLQAVLWRYHNYSSATLTATFIGMAGAIVMGLIGLFKEEYILLGIAIFGYITCMQQRQMLRAGMLEADNEWGYDFSRGHAAFEDRDAGARPSWWARRRLARLARREQRERLRRQQLEEKLDRILDKVHSEGITALSPKEKKLLESETQRRKQI